MSIKKVTDLKQRLIAMMQKSLRVFKQVVVVLCSKKLASGDFVDSFTIARRTITGDFCHDRR